MNHLDSLGVMVIVLMGGIYVKKNEDGCIIQKNDSKNDSKGGKITITTTAHCSPLPFDAFDDQSK